MWNNAKCMCQIWGRTEAEPNTAQKPPCNDDQVFRKSTPKPSYELWLCPWPCGGIADSIMKCRWCRFAPTLQKQIIGAGDAAIRPMLSRCIGQNGKTRNRNAKNELADQRNSEHIMGNELRIQKSYRELPGVTNLLIRS